MANDPRVEITTYAHGLPAILIHVPGDQGGYPVEDIGGEEVLRRYRAFPALLEACRAMLSSPRHGDEPSEEAVEMARAAIALAEPPRPEGHE